jgi:hypothetical protein
MSPRNTRTGGVFEAMILPALRHGGYTFETQVRVGDRLGCGRHMVDAVATKHGRSHLISLKWQQTSGTAEQKVPFEVICLAETLRTSNHGNAYVVLGGDGWKLRDFYTRGGLNEHLSRADRVKIVTLERFTALANTGKL